MRYLPLVPVLIILVMAILHGCRSEETGPIPGRPPVEFTVRDSIIPGGGKVIAITNTSDKLKLDGGTLTIRSADDESRYSHRLHAPLRVRASISVGMIHLDGWKLHAGDRLNFTCDQYTDAATYVIPE